ncbi:hypothetical protein SEA_LIMPID_145 [Streptomyces phage Limpid]|uniref:Uncharacterized protein n=1 Tax=Streptomyces phage Limpid TaxID=2653770 RepID=A0A5Q2WKU3_9CAUD|nr:hypothetical protein SEA_LIMPID_145 [Streptomyces phage Limpid]
MSNAFEFFEAQWEEPAWDALSKTEQLLLVHEAYAEKQFRECDGHAWTLVVDCGQASIQCVNCEGSFEYVAGPDYQDMINCEVDIYYPRIEIEISGSYDNPEREPVLEFYTEHPEDLSGCAYFQGKGTCSYGCWEEPRCHTDEPEGGWPSERFKDMP